MAAFSHRFQPDASKIGWQIILEIPLKPLAKSGFRRQTLQNIS